MIDVMLGFLVCFDFFFFGFFLILLMVIGCFVGLSVFLSMLCKSFVVDFLVGWCSLSLVKI